MLNITHFQRHANRNHNEVPSHASQNGWYPKVYKQLGFQCSQHSSLEVVSQYLGLRLSLCLISEIFVEERISSQLDLSGVQSQQHICGSHGKSWGPAHPWDILVLVCFHFYTKYHRLDSL